MRVFLKRTKLAIIWWVKALYRLLKRSLTYIPTILSVILLMLILVTNLAHRAPIFSYFIEELEFPLTFSLNGRVVNVTGDNTIYSVRANINIGGYQTKTDINGNFHIKFSSPTKTDIPIVITWLNTGEKKTIIRYISFSEKSYNEQKEFFVNDIYYLNYYKCKRK
jgi:hypothetical protein